MVAVEEIWPEWHTQERLGAGTFGTVWRATNARHGSVRACAVKVLEILRSEDDLLPLQDMGLDHKDVDAILEARATALLDEIRVLGDLSGNPHIVRIEDYRLVELSERRGYAIGIRMELLETLPAYYRRVGMPDQTEVARLGIELCEALVACQKIGIIHRDVKPSNIFVGPDGTYKLGDFGIARRLERNTAQTMSRKGTGPYMAPEVFFGKRYSLDVDIYSLGIVLYRYLNERRLPFLPHAPAPIRDSDMEEANRRRLQGEVIPPPAYADASLGRIVCRACAYDALDRYEYPADMQADLVEWLTSTGHDGDSPRLPTDEIIVTEPDANTSANAAVTNSEQRHRVLSRRALVATGVGLGCIVLGVLLVGINSRFRLATSPARKMVIVVTGDYHSVGVREDGSVVACGNDGSGQCDVASWSNVVAASAGAAHTVGLRDDGGVVACGDNRAGQCDVGGWTDVSYVAAGSYHTIGVRSDGSVVACGNDGSGQCDVASWSNVVAASAGAAHTVGLRDDGSVVACGDNRAGQCDVGRWTGVTAISCGPTHTVALHEDGTVVAAGTGYYSGIADIDGLKNVTGIFTGACGTIAVKADGTLTSLGSIARGPAANEMASWHGVTLASVGDEHVVALCENGAIISCGSNAYGQLDTDEW